MPIFDQSAYEDSMREQTTITPAASDPERGQWTSASSAEADTLCHARHRRCLGLPDTTSDDASRGTRIHAALAGEPIALIGEERECAEQLLEQYAEVLFKWRNGETGDLLEQNEIRLWASFDNGLWHSGKPDKVTINPARTRALVVDWKTGRSEVTESPRNLQLRDLAVLVALEYSVQEVTVCIIQPFSQPVLCTYEAHDLALAMSELENRVTACNAPEAAAVPGETQCRYCKAKAQCPEFLASCSPPVDIDLPSMAKVPLAIAGLDSQRLGVFLGLVRLAADTAEEETRKRLAAGTPVPGWKLGEPGTRETITDPNRVHERFVNQGGTTAQFLECITVAKAKLKTALKAATGLKGKELDGALKDMVAGCTETKETAPKLEKE